MNLRTQILQKHSKANAVMVADWIGDNARRFRMLINLFLSDESRVSQRAAHIISIVADQHPAMPAPHLPAILAKMLEPGAPAAVKRNVVRMLQFQNIPEALHGEVMNACFNLLCDVTEPIAVRVSSMTVLANLSDIYPEIRPELRTVIEEGLEQTPRRDSDPGELKCWRGCPEK